MCHNTFGHLFRVTTFGESHGVAIGCAVDGCPPLISLEESDIQQFSRSAPLGAEPFYDAAPGGRSSQNFLRRFYDEKTKHQVTTGTPIALLIEKCARVSTRR